MFQLLIISGVLLKAAESHISASGALTANYGSDALYRCTVANPEGVLQVTWQRLFKDGSIENLATHGKRFGQQVNEPFQGKVVLNDASLNSTSITVKNVTWNDEGCYICSFNAYPDGSKRKHTCLTVQGISEVETDAQASGSEHEEEDVEVLFSCSTTGKPPPTIQWSFPEGASPLKPPRSATATNSDHTFTSSSNVSLRVPPDWSGYVDCLLNSGMSSERRERIPISLSPGIKEKDGKRLSVSGAAVVICALLVLCIAVVAAAAAIRRERLNGRRKREVMS